MSAPRPSIGRWLIVVPMGLAGATLVLFALSVITEYVDIWWHRHNPGSWPHEPVLDNWTLHGATIVALLLGLALLAGAWLLVRRREGQEGKE